MRVCVGDFGIGHTEREYSQYERFIPEGRNSILDDFRLSWNTSKRRLHVQIWRVSVFPLQVLEANHCSVADTNQWACLKEQCQKWRTSQTVVGGHRGY